MRARRQICESCTAQLLRQRRGGFLLVGVHGIEDIAHERVETVCQKTWLGHGLSHRRRFAATWFGRNRAPSHEVSSQAPASSTASALGGSSCIHGRVGATGQTGHPRAGMGMNVRRARLLTLLKWPTDCQQREHISEARQRKYESQVAMVRLAPQEAPGGSARWSVMSRRPTGWSASAPAATLRRRSRECQAIVQRWIRGRSALDKLF